jgi:hypothetical protein
MMIASMGWLKHILLGDLGQSIDIMDAKEAMAGQAALQIQQSKGVVGANLEIARLRRRNEQLHLAITALTRHLITKGVVDAAELAAFIDEIDLMDGKVDGALAFEDKAPAPTLVTGPQARPLRLDR